MTKNGTETWKDIKGYENTYMVSNLGRVISKERVSPYVGRWGNEQSQIVKQKEKISRLSKNGYVTVALCKNNKTYITYLHRIIAQAFIENPNNLKVVNHINGIKTDNSIGNLEWCTSSHNNQHALDNKLRKQKFNLIDLETGKTIKSYKKMGFTNVKIASLVGLSKGSVGGFLRGDHYRNVINELEKFLP